MEIAARRADCEHLSKYFSTTKTVWQLAGTFQNVHCQFSPCNQMQCAVRIVFNFIMACISFNCLFFFDVQELVCYGNLIQIQKIELFNLSINEHSNNTTAFNRRNVLLLIPTFYRPDVMMKVKTKSVIPRWIVEILTNSLIRTPVVTVTHMFGPFDRVELIPIILSNKNPFGYHFIIITQFESLRMSFILLG